MNLLKITCSILFLFALLSADTFLITTQNLPLDRRSDFNVVDVVDDVYLILGTEQTQKQLSTFRFDHQVLDKNPLQSGAQYYTVLKGTESTLNIMKTAQVLADYENMLVVKVNPQQSSAFLDLDLDRILLTFEPYVFRTSVSPEMVNRKVVHQDVIEQMVKAVTEESVRSHVKTLEEYDSRKAASSCMKETVVPWLVDKFKEFGADSVFRAPVSSNYGDNVVAIIFGSNNDRKTYSLMVGHSDAVVGGPPAAGADDNASGTAGTLEAIKVLSKYNFKNDIRCIALNAEEVGLVGAGKYASYAKNDGHKLLGGCINFDMIGYSRSTPTLFMHYKTNQAGNTEFVKLFQDVAKKYVPALKITSKTSSDIMTASDHARFWSNGFAAFLGIDAAGRSTLPPDYHKPGDRLDRQNGLNDSKLMTNVIKAGVAVLADLAIPEGTNIQPQNGQFVTGNSFTVSQNALQSTTIHFSVENQTVPVKMVLYSLNGKNIAILTNRTYQPGRYSVNIPEEFNTGLYIIEYKKGNTVLAKKCITLQ